jgi:hypothetical protein
MAAAFERAGWVNFERTINMTWQTLVDGWLTKRPPPMLEYIFPTPPTSCYRVA